MSDDFMRHTDISWNGNVGKVEYGGGDTPNAQSSQVG